MLAFLRGTILLIRETSLIVDVHDIGYAVFAPGNMLFLKKIGEPIELFLYQHVREDGLDLYGFESRDELFVFEKLISVSGIGPKTALNALSSTTAESIKRAISRGDAGLLKAVSGIGAKTAERIMIELKGSFRGMENEAGAPTDTELIEALIGLGYAARDAQNALREIGQGDLSIEDRLKAALQVLASGRTK